MKLALFGGTFDPVHLGHLAMARSAAQKFGLKKVYFVPADLPPHKRNRVLTPFHHRFAMLALATTEDERFIPSLLESNAAHPNYSIDTVRRFKKTLGKNDQLYFLIGADAFMEISTWKEPLALLKECDFIVAGRPGFSLKKIGTALPEKVRPSPAVLEAMEHQEANGSIVLPSATIHVLPEVNEEISSTAVRAAAAHKSVKQLSRYVPAAVAAYIKKEHLYTAGEHQKADGGSGKVLSFHRARS